MYNNTNKQSSHLIVDHSQRVVIFMQTYLAIGRFMVGYHMAENGAGADMNYLFNEGDKYSMHFWREAELHYYNC